MAKGDSYVKPKGRGKPFEEHPSKTKAVTELREGKNPANVAKKYGISITTIYRWQNALTSTVLPPIVEDVPAAPSSPTGASATGPAPTTEAAGPTLSFEACCVLAAIPSAVMAYKYGPGWAYDDEEFIRGGQALQGVMPKLPAPVAQALVANEAWLELVAFGIVYAWRRFVALAKLAAAERNVQSVAQTNVDASRVVYPPTEDGKPSSGQQPMGAQPEQVFTGAPPKNIDKILERIERHNGVFGRTNV
jgi:hypothetical protein